MGAVAKPENFERAFLYRVNGVYRDYGGGLVIKTTVTQEKNFYFF